MLKYTLGSDVGTNSIGWAVLKINKDGTPQKIEKLGSRIFTDGRNPKDQTTLAASRRQKRHERRRRDRFHQRKKLVINQLIEMGLFPKNEIEQQELKTLDVLTLRSQAPTHKLSAYELGRVIYHLNLKRGFKSGRKDSGSEEDKNNKIADRIENFKKQLDENSFKTVGQYLHSRYTQGLSTKATIENDFHLLRKLIEDEFDAIVEKQKKFHLNISQEAWQKLKGRIFYQRPLKPVETGKCSLFGDDGEHYRTHKYMPSFEYYRFLTELFNLSYQDKDFKGHRLSTEQVFQIYNELKDTKEVSYTKIKKLLKIPEVKFSIEDTKKNIKISTTNAFFSKELLFGREWDDLSLQLKDKVAETYFSEEPIENIKQHLISLKLDSEIIENLMSEKVPNISEVTCPFSTAALQKIVSLIIEEKRHPSLVVDDLMKNEKKDTSHKDKLGYYGAAIPDSMQPIPAHIQRNNTSLNPDEKQYGKIANPTVHAALNQIRHVVNELIDIYGKPENIHIEFARDLKKSREEKLNDTKKNKENEKRNELVKDFIEKHKQKPTAFNMERVKLWFEMDAMNNQMCVYSGKTISQRMVLTDEVQVDHILPFSRTLDDGLNNKVLVLASENMKKKNRTPYEAFHSDTKKWAEIQERAKKLPYKKQWRFAEDAIKTFEENDQFLQRHLNDTRYISKAAKKYLKSIADESKIVASKGGMTSLVRGKLGLNQFVKNADGSKNREDHRHHAIDALTVALTSRSYLKQISDATSKRKDANKISMPEPWENFIKDAEKKFNEILVSHKVDHGKNGPFMDETCFGLIQNPNEYELKNDYRLVTSRTVSYLKEKPKYIKDIRDEAIRSISLKTGLASINSKIKKLKVYEKSKENQNQIGSINSSFGKIQHGKNKQHTKVYVKSENNYVAIWFLHKDIITRNGNNKKRKSDYIVLPIKTLNLNSNNLNLLKPHPSAKLIQKIYLNDTVAIEIDNKIIYCLLKGIDINESNNRIYLQKIYSTNAKDKFQQSVASLANVKFRKIHISPTGKIQDNGPILK